MSEATELADWLKYAGAGGVGAVRQKYDRIEAVLRRHDELLAACEELMAAKEYDGGRWVGKLFDAAELVRAAIAKAKGQS